MAVTRISLPSGGVQGVDDMKVELGLRACRSGTSGVGGNADLGGDLGDRLHRRRAGNLNVGLDRRRHVYNPYNSGAQL